MIFKRLSSRDVGGVAEVEEHDDLLVFGQVEEFFRLVGVEEVQPAVLDVGVCRREAEVRRNDRRIFDAALVLVAWIREDVRRIKRDEQHDGRAVAAGRELVDFLEPLFRLDDIDVLLLQVLRRRRKAAGRENGVERLLRVTSENSMMSSSNLYG